ncbi:hypothetical protein MC378_14705 [Polaribacter sp. MSW13]|uniref:Uncharacterized protein n=1 Tax=Polaribacter marinus TaxID=2916838 RepID=A0A9X2AKT0_9FLAO|nr:hypothetical protein [Polaribacter marinus]MCI2230427.1 hypothetical protein [Polaribacter marinus]
MNKMWSKLGFRENPYDTKPLNVLNSDVELLLGRETEQVDFLTAIESESQGIFILSGVPGVGKTSFFNIQQYLLESEEAQFGPKMLSARNLCPIQPSDEPKNIAIRCIQSFCNSIEKYCLMTKNDIPPQTSKIQAWVYQNKPATFNFGVSILGNGVSFGREIHLQSINETTYETLVEIISTLALEVNSILGFSGSFIVLDNVENLHEEDLSDCLTTFRDTLFTIPHIWWVLIGQSGLTSLIQSTNPKVFQRLSAGIELKPISIENLIKAVDVRVNRFHCTDNIGSSPITEEIYLKLFDSSNGEIRFVFKYCQAICINLVQSIRKALIDKNVKIDDENFEKQMGEHLVNKQIDNEFSNICLNYIISEEFRGLYLNQDEKDVLKKIGEMKRVRPSNFKEFNVGTMQNFTQKYLVKMKDQQLLFRRQQGSLLTYELRGISIFASEYGLLEE